MLCPALTLQSICSLLGRLLAMKRAPERHSNCPRYAWTGHSFALCPLSTHIQLFSGQLISLFIGLTSTMAQKKLSLHMDSRCWNSILRNWYMPRALGQRRIWMDTNNIWRHFLTSYTENRSVSAIIQWWRNELIFFATVGYLFGYSVYLNPKIHD